MEVVIEEGPIYSRVLNPTRGLESIIDSVTSFRPANYFFSKPFREGRWDGIRHLYSRRFHTFPSGLLTRVQEVLHRCGLEVTVISHNEPAPVKPDFNTKPPLRDYQKEAVRVGLAKRRGIFHCTLGSGKTILSVSLIKSLDQPTLFLVHRKELLYQTGRILRENLGKVGIIGGGRFVPKKFSVASFQTLVSQLDTLRVKNLLDSTKVVVVDECHHVPSKTLYRVLMKIPAPFRYGLSATSLDRDDNKNMLTIAALGPIIFELSAEPLIERGLLLRPEVFILPVKEPKLSCEYEEARKYGIIENKVRNEMIAKIARNHHDLSTVILVREIEHGKILSKMLGCPFVYGGQSTEYRQQLLERFRQKKEKLIVVSNIWGEGVDIVNLNVIIIAAGGKSTIQSIQRLGRGMRYDEKFPHLLVYDFLDETNTYLLQHSKKRIADYKKLNAKICEVSQ